MQNIFDRIPLDPRIKKLLPVFIYSLFFLIILGGAWWASSKQKPTNEGVIGQAAVSDLTGSLVGAFFKLLLVFALMFLTFTILKWWQTKRPGQLKKKLLILETINITPRRSIHLIKIGSKAFLVGATDHSLNLISEVPVEEDPVTEIPDLKGVNNFEQVLAQTLIAPFKGIQKCNESRANLTANEK